ncbi:putative RING-H2 finger protein ATL49 [Diospyros lotus]|uniref:putative RING-H2 finger protein ATL49 n=1 Tax=Diospyros lotus TaxID=55363 RepID=UPI00225A9833|nr:putative RING-H2 finger protein ATL49 [Diospyros lotus]
MGEIAISPNLAIVVVAIAAVFFISCLVHLIRFLVWPRNQNPEDSGNGGTTFHGPLRELFVLHDEGLDQDLIDALPIFKYSAVAGVEYPFDCAVCLSEFKLEDSLRLLPDCSHAFHMDCIDKWLLSHSTCPLCRASLLDPSPDNRGRPTIMIVESVGDISREIFSDGDDTKSSEIEAKDDSNQPEIVVSEEKVVAVKLGKCRNMGGAGEGGYGDRRIDGRRCFSMGSFAYVMDENLVLQVPIRAPAKKGPVAAGLAPRRAYSLHFPETRNAVSGELGCGEERLSTKTPSFARRTLLWLVGRQESV